jgi:hypothetical protein
MQMIQTLILAVMPFVVQQAPDVSQARSESAAFAQIGAEKNLEAKKKLVAGFEKNFPKSSHLPEMFMDLSHALVAATDFASAKQYAEKAVTVVAKMKTEPADAQDRAHQNWLDSMDTSTKKNLAWVNQMIAWQEQQVRSSVLTKRR